MLLYNNSNKTHTLEIEFLPIKFGDIEISIDSEETQSAISEIHSKNPGSYTGLIIKLKK